MFEWVPYKREHILSFIDQNINKDTKELFTSDQLLALENTEADTAMWNGTPMACTGIVKCWEGRGLIWVVFNEKSKESFLPVFRGFKKRLPKLGYRRLEVAIPYSFELGKRRALMLGFKLECPLAKNYLPNGEDCALYAWVRE